MNLLRPHPMFATCEPCSLHPIQGRLKLAEVLTPQNDTAQGLQHIHGSVETQITRTAGSWDFRRIQSDTQLFEFLHEGFFALQGGFFPLQGSFFLLQCCLFPL